MQRFVVVCLIITAMTSAVVAQVSKVEKPAILKLVLAVRTDQQTYRMATIHSRGRDSCSGLVFARDTVSGRWFSLVSMVSINLGIWLYGVERGDTGESIEPEERHQTRGFPIKVRKQVGDVVQLVRTLPYNSIFPISLYTSSIYIPPFHRILTDAPAKVTSAVTAKSSTVTN